MNIRPCDLSCSLNSKSCPVISFVQGDAANGGVPQGYFPHLPVNPSDACIIQYL
ncbi:17641_t:CDS:2 [Acaulospora colombiana]|uniref:17641_t:CDS:1 n=1 Tax=Acaulospora colombiana TaxID=27376 RepID=A0ACA9LQY9_9GLOM|nr:17641_t:CDS:2 [Acaulospora colombiana]